MSSMGIQSIESRYGSYEEIACAFSSAGNECTEIYLYTATAHGEDEPTHYKMVRSLSEKEALYSSTYVKKIKLAWSKETGARIPYKRPPAAVQSTVEITAEQDVTLEKMKGIFSEQGFPCRWTPGDALIVEAKEPSFNVVLQLFSDARMLVFWAALFIRKSVPIEKKIRWVHELNNSLNMVRFRIKEPDFLNCQYYMSYQGGIMPKQVVANLRQFAMVCRRAVSKYDPEHIFGKDKSGPD